MAWNACRWPHVCQHAAIAEMTLPQAVDESVHHKIFAGRAQHCHLHGRHDTKPAMYWHVHLGSSADALWPSWCQAQKQHVQTKTVRTLLMPAMQNLAAAWRMRPVSCAALWPSWCQAWSILRMWKAYASAIASRLRAFSSACSFQAANALHTPCTPSNVLSRAPAQSDGARRIIVFVGWSADSK